MQAYFKVYLQADENVLLSDFCPKLHQMLFNAVKHVLTTFNYSKSDPIPAFKCSCTPHSHALLPRKYGGKEHLINNKCKSSKAVKEQHTIWKVNFPPLPGKVFLSTCRTSALTVFIVIYR